MEINLAQLSLVMKWIPRDYYPLTPAKRKRRKSLIDYESGKDLPAYSQIYLPFAHFLI